MLSAARLGRQLPPLQAILLLHPRQLAAQLQQRLQWTLCQRPQQHWLCSFHLVLEALGLGVFADAGHVLDHLIVVLQRGEQFLAEYFRLLSSGILPTWHKRVNTCLNHVYDVYVLCNSTYTSYTWFRHVYTFHEMYGHVHTVLNIYEHVYTWYIHVHTL